jgi:glycosyltransferase involved in cell wall biosynthesis
MNHPAIVHVAAYYPPHLGGLERVARMAAEGCADTGHRVLVITSDQNGAPAGTVYPRQNLEVRSLHSFEFAHTPLAPLLLGHLLTLPRHAIMHLHLAQANWPEFTLLASKLRGIPYVAHFHLDVEPSGRLGWIFLIHKKIIWGPVLRNASRVIACSDEQARVVAQKFGVPKERITVIPNAVGKGFFADRAYAPSAQEVRLLSIGRLASQKKVERIIEAMRFLTIPARLMVVGDGEERMKLEALAHTLGLSNVSFVGAKDDAAMQAQHRASDIFLISSEKEGGTPLVALEAMAAGLPIIGTDVSGIRELVEGVGVLVEEPYAQNLAVAIERVWRDRAELMRLSAQSREKATHYTPERFVSALERVYAGIIL